jgi:hypothetical protein
MSMGRGGSRDGNLKFLTRKSSGGHQARKRKKGRKKRDGNPYPNKDP